MWTHHLTPAGLAAPTVTLPPRSARSPGMLGAVVADLLRTSPGEAPGCAEHDRVTAILEQMDDAHCELDSRFHFLSVNAAAECLLGVPRTCSAP